MSDAAAAIEEIVNRETRAWDTRDLDLLLSVFHPDLVWPWPPHEDAHDPMEWVMPWGRYNEERWRAGWGELFGSHELVHNRRRIRRIEVTPEGDGAFAVVDVDTLWRDGAGTDLHWFGRACKIYSRVGSEWKMTAHTGLLRYPAMEDHPEPGVAEAADLAQGPAVGGSGARGPIRIQPIGARDEPWVAERIEERWSSRYVVSRGRLHEPANLPGFVARIEDRRVGLVTYRIAGDECELITIDSLREGMGVGSALIEAVREAAQEAGCRRLWLITTNDNLPALRFYQKRGFALVAVHCNGLARSRELKPEIPDTGLFGITLRDELELEMTLEPMA